MKYILITILVVIGLTTYTNFAGAVTGENIFFDWSWGQPTFVDDPTNLCDNQAIALFDWSWGKPTIVYDATATCESAVVEVPVVIDDFIMIIE